MPVSNREQQVMRSLLVLLLTFFIYIDQASAYIGPGVGLGAIGALIGVVVTVVLAIIGLLWYPLKRLYRRQQSKPVQDEPDDK
jgi:hypothetical protein